MIDYHIHTLLCNHARKNMASYVKKAINIGLQEICFLDHLIIGENGRKNSMTAREVGLYFQAAQQLKYQYRSKIKVRVGLEVDFHPDYVNPVQELIQGFSFDVIGSSVHFANNVNIVSRRGQSGQTTIAFQELCHLYLKELDRMLDYDYFDLICHLDVIKKFEKTLPNDLNKKFDEILSKISYKKLIVEVNTSGNNHPIGDTYPDLDLLKKCFRKGIEITLSSDAHHPDSVGQYFDQTLSDLAAIGYRQLTGFFRRQRHIIPIDHKGGYS